MPLPKELHFVPIFWPKGHTRPRPKCKKSSSLFIFFHDPPLVGVLAIPRQFHAQKKLVKVELSKNKTALTYCTVSRRKEVLSQLNVGTQLSLGVRGRKPRHRTESVSVVRLSAERESTTELRGGLSHTISLFSFWKKEAEQSVRTGNFITHATSKV